MKVTSDNNTQLNPGTKIEKESSGNDLDALAGEDIELDGLPEKRSFASVLDRVTQSHREPVTKSAEKHSDGPPATHAGKASLKDDKPEDTEALAVADRQLMREPLAATEANPDARALLHT